MNLLLATLCTRSIQTREGIIIKALDCNAAVSSRDALAKTVYARLFDWYAFNILPFQNFIVSTFLGRSSSSAFLCSDIFHRLVDKINTTVGQDLNSQIQIGVLDIYGFECFKDNR